MREESEREKIERGNKGEEKSEKERRASFKIKI